MQQAERARDLVLRLLGAGEQTEANLRHELAIRRISVDFDELIDRMLDRGLIAPTHIQYESAPAAGFIGGRRFAPALRLLPAPPAAVDFTRDPRAYAGGPALHTGPAPAGGGFTSDPRAYAEIDRLLGRR